MIIFFNHKYLKIYKGFLYKFILEFLFYKYYKYIYFNIYTNSIKNLLYTNI
jgi:hypothetical protein